MQKMAASRDAKDPWGLRDMLIVRDVKDPERLRRSTVDNRLDMAAQSHLDVAARVGRPR